MRIVRDALLCSPVWPFGFCQLEEKQCETSLPIKKEMSQYMAFSMRMKQYQHFSHPHLHLQCFSELVQLRVFNHQGYLEERRGSLNSCKVLYQYSWLLSMQTRGKGGNIPRLKVLMRLSSCSSVAHPNWRVSRISEIYDNNLADTTVDTLDVNNSWND